MKSEDVMRRFIQADPLNHISAELDLVVGQHDDLIDGVLATPLGDSPPAMAPRRRNRRLMTGFVLGAVCLAAFGLILSVTGSDHDDGTAYASELVEFAEASPLVLVDLPNWRVTYVDEETSTYGNMDFVNQPKDGPAIKPRISLELTWLGVSPAHREKRFEHSMHQIASNVPVLGTTTNVFQLGHNRHRRELLSTWAFEGRVLETRMSAPNLTAYKRILAGLKRVDVDTWLDAMPPSVINTFERPDEVGKMLKGIPLPPGFKPSDIHGAHLTKDAYQLGAAVTGTIACKWVRNWAIARRDHDPEGVKAAVDAMGTSHHWPVLQRMLKTGSFSQVVWQYADAMAQGSTFYGRPIESDVSVALGCPALGVHIPITNS